MRFAARADFGESDAESSYGRALREARLRGGVIDLTVSNPTRCGFAYPADRILAALANPDALGYDADPLGLPSARQAVSKMYREQYGAVLEAEHILLTASTSEAYSYLLRMFCDPGDAILVPSPSYPLFDLLARLHDVELIPYPLVYHDGWQIDPASLAAAVTPRTRAVFAIHPNNPTGHYCSSGDREALHAVAQRHDLPLIVDEVFLDYRLDDASGAESSGSFARPGREAGSTGMPQQSASLTFVLSGLSKLLAMPQMKLAWIAVCGREEEVSRAMRRLEIIADTFLSIATPPQLALPAWLNERGFMQAQILSRVQENLAALDRALHGSVVSRLRVEGGWAVVVRVPALEPDIELAVRLLRDCRLAVHPGSFYGLANRGWLVLSLLPEEGIFREGAARLLAAFAGADVPHA